MLLMEKELQDQQVIASADLKKDIQEGKIWGLRLIKTPVEVIRDNSYAMLFNMVREISGFDDEKFFLRTKQNNPVYYDYKNYDYQKPNGYVSGDEYCECEAYYRAFNYYDGNILRASEYFSSCINEEDQNQVTEYEVLHIY